MTGNKTLSPIILGNNYPAAKYVTGSSLERKKMLLVSKESRHGLFLHMRFLIAIRTKVKLILLRDDNFHELYSIRCRQQQDVGIV